MFFSIFKYNKVDVITVLLCCSALFAAIGVCIFFLQESVLIGIHFNSFSYELIENMPVWIYVVICFIVVSVLCLFVFIGLSLYFDLRRSWYETLKERYYQFFTIILTTFFITEVYADQDNRKKLLRRIKPFVKSRIQLIALFDSYLRIQEMLTTDLSEDCRFLISVLNLQRKLDDLINYRRFDDKILAMRMFSYLRIHSCENQIINCAKSDNIALRTEAYAALVRLMEKDEYLIHIIGEGHKLSLVDVNVIVNAIINNKKMNVNCQILLSSANESKIIIGLILVKYGYEKGRVNLALINNHIGSSNPLIKELVWDALLYIMPDNDCVDIIIDRFEGESNAIKLLILEKSHHVLDKRFSNFLASIIEHQTLLVRIEAMKIIFTNDFDLVETFMSSDNDQIIKAYNEVSCMYINK